MTFKCRMAHQITPEELTQAKQSGLHFGFKARKIDVRRYGRETYYTKELYICNDDDQVLYTESFDEFHSSWKTSAWQTYCCKVALQHYRYGCLAS